MLSGGYGTLARHGRHAGHPVQHAGWLAVVEQLTAGRAGTPARTDTLVRMVAKGVPIDESDLDVLSFVFAVAAPRGVATATIPLLP